MKKFHLLTTFGTWLLLFDLGNFLTDANDLNETFLLKSNRQLQFVLAIWRHGDRAPKMKPYADDKHDESAWPRGWSQLTNEGMVQMRELGDFFRKRYTGGFISPQFNIKEVFITSSHSDRALTSAQAFSSGLYPPGTTNEYFDPNIQWQPVPIHTIGELGNDPFLKGTSFNCPSYNKLKKEAQAKLEETLRPQYEEFFEFLRPILKSKEPKISLRAATKLGDIEREVLHNMSQPEWVLKRWPNYSNKTTITIISELRNLERDSLFNELRKYQLTGGLLLGEWVRQLKAISNQIRKGEIPKKRPSKMSLYSAHDGALRALKYALQADMKGDTKVPYASCIILELYSTDNNTSMEVELFYRRNNFLETLKIDGCNSTRCPLERVLEIWQPIAIPKKEILYSTCGLNYCGDLSVQISKATNLLPSNCIIFSLIFLSIVLNFWNKF